MTIIKGIIDSESFKSGRGIISREVLSKAIAKYNEVINQGYAIGAMDYSRSLADASHKVTECTLEDNTIKVELKTLNTPKGLVLQDIIRNTEVDILPTGYIGHDHLTITSFTVVLKRSNKEIQ